MGLDQYLFRRPKGANKKWNEEVAYWRKDYNLREWFIVNIPEFQHLDNGVYHKVTRTILKRCIKAYKDLLAQRDTNELLFDNWDYQDYQIKDTIEKLQNVLDTTDWKTEIVYYYDDF